MERRSFLRVLLGAAATLPILHALPAFEPYVVKPPSLAAAYAANLKRWSYAMKHRGMFAEMRKQYEASLFIMERLATEAYSRRSPLISGRRMEILFEV